MNQHEVIRVETPHGPLDLFVYETKIIARDVAGPRNAPAGPEFVVNRVPMTVDLVYKRQSDGTYARSAYPGGGHVAKRWAKSYNDGPSWNAQKKVIDATAEAIAANADAIAAVMPKLRTAAALARLQLATKETEWAREALAKALANEEAARIAFDALN